MLESIFETKRGIYQRDTQTGLFTVLGERTSTPNLFLGSIDPQSQHMYHGKERSIEIIPRLDRLTMVFDSIAKGHTNKFTPEFKEGYMPLGIVCDPKDIELVGEGLLVFSPEFKTRILSEDPNVKCEIGSVITHVYRQLTPQDRPYLRQ